MTELMRLWTMGVGDTDEQRAEVRRLVAVALEQMNGLLNDRVVLTVENKRLKEAGNE